MVQKEFPALRSGMRVECKNGTIYLVIYNGTRYFLLDENWNIVPFDHNDYLSNRLKNELGIIKVFDKFDKQPFDIKTPIWNKYQVLELTIQDIADMYNIPAQYIKIVS